MVQETSEAVIEAATVEFEQVTVKVPRLVMEFLRKTEGNAVEWIEYTVVDVARAQLEGMTPEEWIEQFKLGHVFKTVLDDDRFTK